MSTWGVGRSSSVINCDYSFQVAAGGLDNQGIVVFIQQHRSKYFSAVRFRQKLFQIGFQLASVRIIDMDDLGQQRLGKLHLPSRGQNFLVRLQLADDIGFVVKRNDAEQVALPGVGETVRFQYAFKHLIPWKFGYVEAGDSP